MAKAGSKVFIVVNWDDARLLDGLCYDLVLSDAPRGENRALIAATSNGEPPYTDREVEENQINVNVNDLSMTRALHEARSQLANGLLKTGNFFKARTDLGPRHKRTTYSTIVTSEINKRLKKSIKYFEANRSKIGLLTLHGISPGVWQNEDGWCTRSLGVGDVLMPSDTLLGFENLPFFVLRRSWTGIELQKITQSSKRDPGWNMDLINRCLDWIDKQTTQLRGNNWPDVWSPEKVSERRKQDGGFYANDRAPTVETFDIYAYSESEKESGWIRRIILDTWGTPASQGIGYNLSRNAEMKAFEPNDEDDNDFLFNSGTRKVGETWQNIISFQFADLSAVAPFRYHSVRSLGFLLWAVCHLSNRMGCSFNESVFETLMMICRVKSMDDVQRALKVNLINKGFIDDTISFVPQNERWNPNEGLVEMAMQRLNEQIQSSTGAFAQRRNFSKDKMDKTRFQVMAEVNADTALISSALEQAYKYQSYEDSEIFRRFMKPHSTDPDVREARAAILKQGVPEKLLVPEAWDVEHERVMGGGNKTMELTQAQQIMEWRQFLDPQPQRVALRNAMLALTDNAALTDELVPEVPTISDSVHDSELAFGSLMAGSQVTPKPGLNAVEVAGTILKLMANKVKIIMTSGGVGTPQDIAGLSAAAQYVTSFIQILSQDKSAKQIVKKLGDALGKIMNEVKGMAQRQQEAMQKAQQNGDQIDPKDKAKIAGMMMTSKAKADNARESHADKTAQRRISFEQKTKQDQQKHQMEMREKAIQLQADIVAKDLTTASEIHRKRSAVDEDND